MPPPWRTRCKQSVGRSGCSTSVPKLSCDLMTRRNHLEQCAASVETDALSHVHGALRVLENDIRAIDRMLDSLARRFPDAVPTLQQA